MIKLPTGNVTDINLKDFDAESVGRLMIDVNFLEIFNTLQSREQMVLVYRYGLLSGDRKTLRETGENFGVTSERIRQIEAKALKKLTYVIKERNFRTAVSQGIIEIDDIDIRELDISKRMKIGLLHGDIRTIKELRRVTVKELLWLPGVGPRSVQELLDLIYKEFDITLYEDRYEE